MFRYFYVLTADAKMIAGTVHNNEYQVPHKKHSIVRTTESVKKLSPEAFTLRV